jgi:L-cysteine:1D-myo-inositol 2-amino-2-deoxy-alpha-D-glucopyranoside ligase
MADAAGRLARWRSGCAQAVGAGDSAAAGPLAAAEVTAAMRERLADDLDAPGALAAVDRWAAVAAAGQAAGSGPAVRAAVDALLGVEL